MVDTLEHTTEQHAPLPAPTRSRRGGMLGWVLVVAAAALAATLAIAALTGDSGSGPTGAVFTEHGRIKAVENQLVDPAPAVVGTGGAPSDGTFTEHGTIKAVDDDLG